MRKFILSLLVSIFVVPVSYISAQIIAFDNPEPEIQRARIGLVDEFMKRFNGDEIHPDIISSDTDSINRNLIGLFDLDQFINQDKEVQDSIRAEALYLIKTIINDSIRINYSDSTWVAIAHCKGFVMGKQENFDIFLTVQSRGDEMYKWVINAVEGECFNANPRNVNENLIISPEAHETKFIALQRILKEQPYNIQLYISKKIAYDPTSVFTYLIYSGKLKIEYVERLEFVFLQVPNYAFHIQYFDRSSNNSGWLISNFYHFSDSDKSSFLKMINQEALIDNDLRDDTRAEESYEVIPDKIPVEIQNSNSVNKLLVSRVNERIQLLKNYVSYIDSCDNKSSQQYYKNKLSELFSPDAKAIIKNAKTGDLKVLELKKFADNLLNKKYPQIYIDAITSVILKRNENDNNEENVLCTGIVPLPLMQSDEVLNSIYDKLLPYHLEDTEDGVEYIFDFGDIYITLN